MATKSTSHTSTRRSSRKTQNKASRALLMLHVATTIFAFPAVIITIATVALWNANFFHKSGTLRGDWADGLLLIPLTIAFVISLTYTITACLTCRRQHQRQKGTAAPEDYLRTRNQRPTAQIFPMLATITILALLVPLLALAGASGLFRLWQPTVSSLKQATSSTSPSSALTLTSTSTLSSLLSAVTRNHIVARSLTASKSSLVRCTLSEIFTRPCNPTLFTIGSLQISIIALSSLIWLLELAILFQQIKQHRYAKHKHSQGLRYKARALTAEKSPTKSTHPARYTYKSRSTRPANPSAPAVPSPTKSRERAGLNRTASDSSTLSHFSSSQASDNASDPSGRFITRPKQYHYDPQITRSRSQREACMPGTGAPTPGPRIARSPPTYVEGSGVSDADRVAAIEEVRLKLRPSETMGAFLAARYA